MSNQQPTGSMTDADTGARAEVQKHWTTARGLAGPRRFAGLALAAALLLALGFATGRATDRLWPVNATGGAPAAPQARTEEQPARADYRAQHEGLSPAAPAAVEQTLVDDGYAPNAMDYREDHRVAAPAYGTDPTNYREDHRSDAAALPALAADDYTPTRLDYREDHRLNTPALPPLADDGYTSTRMDYREDHRQDPRQP